MKEKGEQVKIKDETSLYILGNGFDICLGMASKYSDFFNSPEMMELYKLYKKERWSILKKNEDTNFFLAYLFSRKWYDPDWNVVEKQIIGYVIKTAKKYKIYIEEPVLDEINKENSQKIVENIEYLVKKIRQKQLEKEGEILKKGQKIIQDLNWFEKSFGRYVENQTYEAKDMDEKLNEIFQLKKRGLRNIKIINFNYTSKVRKGLSDLMKSMIDVQNENFIEQINVHGNTENPIFGIDIKEIEDVDDQIREILNKLTKTARVMAEDTISQNWILPKEITDINFFGHSLSRSDYSYFQSIFDFYDIYSSKVRLNFLYNKNLEGSAERQHSSVMELMESYGKSLENKEKGKNLLHKMLLENRIKLLGLDV